MVDPSRQPSSPRRDAAPPGPAVFLFWCREGEGSGRGVRMARALGAAPVHVWRGTLGPFRLPTPLRYVAQWVDTARALRCLRPSAIYVQVPPVFALLQAVLYAAPRGIPVAADNHSSFLDGRWRWFHWLQRPLARRLRANLAHNEANEALLRAWGAGGAVLVKSPAVARGDMLALAAGEDVSAVTAAAGDRLKVLMVNRFAPDDAWREVLRGAEAMPEAHFFLTGDPARAGLAPAAVPANVTLTGLLPRPRFLALMAACDAALTLTLRPDTLLWSIRECLALGVPFTATDSAVTRAEFDGLGEFSAHDPASLRAALLRAVERRAERAEACDAYIARDLERWDRQMAELRARMAPGGGG